MIAAASRFDSLSKGQATWSYVRVVVQFLAAEA